MHRRGRRMPAVAVALARLLVVAVPGVAAAPADASEAAVAPLPEFHRMTRAEDRKEQFFDYLRPLVDAENDRIRAHRERLLGMIADHRAGRPPAEHQQRFLQRLARDYRVDAAQLDRASLYRLLARRVDVIPVGLVLAQAAKESAWGASRFARHGNNLFGLRCFERGCGVVPRDRPAGRIHEVQRFDSVRAAVASYMRNLNSHPGYRDLRLRRQRLRDTGRPLSGIYLAEGLQRYSEEGEKYVRELQGLIRQNGLEAAPATAAAAGGGATVSGL